MSNFFTFPLCLLAYGDDDMDRLQVIVSHSMMRAGGDTSKVTADMIERHAKENGLSANTQEERQIIRGALTIGDISVGSTDKSVQRAKQSQEFLKTHERYQGTMPLVFIAADLLWSCNREELSYREFSVLCALNSIIGFKTSPIQICRPTIIARQLGYKTPALMKAAHERGLSGVLRPSTEKQIRIALDNLENRSLIARYQSSRTVVYFSTTLNYEDLKKAVAGLVERKSKVQNRRQSERQLFEVQAGAKPGPAEGPSAGAMPGPLKEMLLNNSLEVIAQNNCSLTSAGDHARARGSEFQNPTEELVKEWCVTLIGREENVALAVEWFKEHGGSDNWLKKPWQGDCARYIQKRRREERKIIALA